MTAEPLDWSESVTGRRLDQYSSGGTRNGWQTRRPEAVTDNGRGAYAAGPVSVTCTKCGSDIPPDRSCFVRGNERHEEHYCVACADAANVYERDWIIPWLTYGARLDGRHPAEYAHACPRCGREFVGALARVYCSTSCGKATRAARRDRTRDRQARSCETCGEVFTPPRDDARYCSPACRQQAYRRRKLASESS